MDIVWLLGECTSAEVTAEFQKRRRLAPTTIRTVLANLRKKHYLEQVPTIERGFRLKATVSRSDRRPPYRARDARQFVPGLASAGDRLLIKRRAAQRRRNAGAPTTDRIAGKRRRRQAAGGGRYSQYIA